MNPPTHPIKEAQIRLGGLPKLSSATREELSEIENLLSGWLRDNGFDEVGNPPKGKLYLELFHGRKPKDEELDDWGSAGPIFGPLEYVHTTYANHVKFSQQGECCDLHVSDDLIYYDGVWYGDWSVFTLDESPARPQAAEIKARLVPYDEIKSRQ